MNGRKKEGIEGLKDATGGRRREDRELLDRTSFDPLKIDAKNVATVVHLLQSPEELIQLRAVASLEIYGSKCSENLELLCSLGIFTDLFPIMYHPDFIARRFALKLMAMLSNYEDFRQDMYKKDDILETFMTILKTESDAVLQEYASLCLSELSKDYHVASDLLKLEDCWSTLFTRLISADPDIEKNCLEIMQHLLSDVNGLEAFIQFPGCDIKTILNLIYSSYPAIQAAVIDVLKLLTSWCRDTRLLLAFREAMGPEVIMSILEEKLYADLHPSALEVIINVADAPFMCEYLQKSGCLLRLVYFLDNSTDQMATENILAVLARMAKTQKGREALHSVNMGQRFVSYLGIPTEYIQESSCLGIANMSQYAYALGVLIELSPMKRLIGFITDCEKNLELRIMAAYTLNVMCNADTRPLGVVLEEDNCKSLLAVLKETCNSSTELCQNILQVFIEAACNDEIRSELVSEEFLSAIMKCIHDGRSTIKDPSLQVDALECLSELLVDSEIRDLFNALEGVDLVICCLRSKFASVREWAGHLVVVASQSKDFVKNFILKNGLEWMLKEKNSMCSMPSWQSAIETIFANCLPAKFAYTGRLDFQDITQDGFYLSVNPRIGFVLLDYFTELMVSPVAPLYVAIFNTPSELSNRIESSVASSQSQISDSISGEPQKHEMTKEEIKKQKEKLKQYMKGADRNTLEEYQWTGSLPSYTSVDYNEASIKTKENYPFFKLTADPYLNDCLESLKKKISEEELPFRDMNWCCLHPRIIRNRVKIMAEFVAEEMSGIEPVVCCQAIYKTAYINELKYYFGTNILPLGLIRVGDYLERAMLFKVLADRIGFPCALVRGPHGRTWIEIAVPVINVEFPGEWDPEEKSFSHSLIPESLHTLNEYPISESEKTNSQSSKETVCIEAAPEEDFWFPKIQPECFKGFPQNFLKPNAIVDLMVEPGRILHINSFEAKEYCGAFLFP